MSRRFDYSAMNKDFFEEIDSDLKAYWLGFIAADGTLGSKKNYVMINLNGIDINHLLKLSKLLNLPVESTRIRKTVSDLKEIEIASLYFTVEKTYYDILNKGIIPRKSKINIDFTSKIDEKYLLPFIIGYFDGDGSICKYNDDRWIINFSGNKDTLESIQNFLYKNHGFNKNKVKLSNNNTYTINWASKKRFNKFFRVLFKFRKQYVG